MAAPAAVASTAPVATAPAVATYKVFVGNLPFATTNEKLNEEFAPFGKVLSANIITRGPRSLGYGFVEYESLEAAQRAVTEKHKKVIDTREINVEIAKVREQGSSSPSTSAAAGAAPGAAAGTRPPRRPRKPAAAGGSPATSPAAGGAPPAHTGAAADGDAPRRRGRRVRGAAAGTDGAPAPAAAGAGGATAATGAPAATRPPRAARPPRAPAAERPPRTESQTSLFVANLPFSMDDDGLKAVFAGTNPVSAKVVRKPNNKSKGFGFVEFATQADQNKALAAVAGKSVEDRPLNVRVALTGPEIPAATGGAPPAVAPTATPAADQKA